MITLAGTEPSTLFGMSQVLGVGSTEAQKLQAEIVKRMAIMSEPAAVLVNNPDLRASDAGHRPDRRQDHRPTPPRR